ncbi:protein NLRC5-like [Sinocyclocheilus rhinocerous]|uniref:protein NLRC5-like n=1 Tax=Sinocyclocheilus rhinocerous TaxID=307959 RepID=UPI0007B8C6CB|nr:PREDICTED: protein NLRC5-like [Sinocyclocheilus rhinocerous]
MSLPEEESVRSGSHVFSSVSVKSDWSHDLPPKFSEKTPSSPTKSVRSGSHLFSSTSLKSDHSKKDIPNFSEKTPSSPTKSVRSGSHVFSSVSVKSDHSIIFEPPEFSEETISSTKSYKGQKTTVNIGAEFTRWQALKAQKGLKSDVELATFLLNRVQYEKSASEFQTYRLRKEFSENRLWIFQDLENKIVVFLKNELEKLKKILQKENTQYFVQDFNEGMCSIKEAALDITLYFLRDMKQDKLADTLEDELVLIHQRQLKSNLKRKYQCVFEGIAKHGDSTLLNNIYTDLYITLGGSEQVNTEHEVRQIEVAFRRHESQEIQVECTNLFEAPEQDKEIRTVLTKGVAGIGKSVSVQKFVVDWAEEKENQDISFVFPLPFREMNLKEEENQSLMSLITQFFPETKGLNLTRRNQFKVLFILDGLDECRLPLNFEGNETWRDVSSPASLDVLLTNLIKGNLLPSALIWITTRPAAASKIPPDCIDRLTEIRGFNDAQKEEYFRKRFTDQNQANKIVDLVKQSKSLFIMCYIPVFCWISATVLQSILEIKRKNYMKNAKIVDAVNAEDTPKTLTQMYTHFLRFQIQQSRRKYDVSWDKDTILSLGKLAFQQLERNNLIFYDTDLEACGIDVSKASVYSGMCTQIFKEDTGIILGTMYCFVHLSIQEFIAALYAHLFLDINNQSVFNQDSTEQENKSETLTDLLKTAVDKALESDSGHLDLFLRFLLGLSLESSRPLLRGLLTQQDSNDQSYKEIVQYIKQKLDSNLSPERSINLFHCLNELNDQTLVKEIQSQLNKGSLSSSDLSPAQWSAVAFVLLTSEEELEEFDLQKFKKSDECFFRLLEVVKTSKRALLNDCDLTDRSCSALAPVLVSDSNLKELNMNNNNLQDSGVKKLCIGLKSINCKLEILRLRDCGLTEESCSALATVLRSNSSLKELDMRNNNLQDSGVKKLGLENTNCTLEKLRLSNCSITEEGYKAMASALRSNPSHLIELDLTGNYPGPSGVKQLSDILQDGHYQLKTIRFLKSAAALEACKYLTKVLGKSPLLLKELDLSEDKLGELDGEKLSALLMDSHSKVEKMKLNNCKRTKKSCSVLATVLFSKTILKEMNLNNSRLLDSGVKEICEGLKNPVCELKILKLSDCSITEEGYKALASALRSNPSHLIELDLTGNDPGQSGVKQLNDLLQDPNCQLKTLRFLGPAADEACQYVTGIVGKNPLLLRELNLSEHELGDTNMKRLAALLQDKHCTLNTLTLRGCGLTEESCSVLATVLRSNSSLKELDMSNNNLQDSGVKKLQNGLEDTNCTVEKLGLSDCSITEEGYKALASALRSNPSHLIELDLTGNDPGPSGVKQLNHLLQDPNYSLKTLRFLGPAADEACQDVNRVLGENLLLLRELNLSEHELGLSGLNKLAAVLQDIHCKLSKLILNNSDITEEDCHALTAALNSNPSNLTELNLSGTKLRNSGMKIFSTLFKNEKCSLKKLMFNCISITEEGCAALASAFNSNPSNLIELDLSGNKLGNSGVTEISTLLENSQCTLQILRLLDCSITEDGYKALASALRSNPSHLIELDLTGNDPGQSGVKELDDLLQDPNCQLKTLRFLGPAADEACQYVIKVQGENPLLLKELNLSLHELGDTRVNQIAALLQDKHCKLNTLILCGCHITEKQCFILTLALKSNPSHLRELDLSGNKIENKGVKHLCDLLIDFRCKMERLRLRGCDMTDEGCSALTSALKSNPSHLRELDLSENKLGDSGFENISNLLMNPQCKLEILALCKCSIKEKQCVFLTSALKSNPSHLRELDLSGNVLKHTRVNKFYDILKDSRFKLEGLRLRYCAIKAEDCSTLTSALKSMSSHLRELALSGNEIGQLGATNLSDLLMNPQCKLEKLDLCRCSITEKQCLILTSALKSNPSHLRELNISVNQLGDSGVENLGVLLGSSQCKLDKLHLCGCRITEKHCFILTSDLCSNLSHLRELDLSGNKIENKGVQILCDILNNSHCKLERLSLNDCGITDVACLAQSLAETKVLLFLKELDLSNNKIGDSKQQLMDVLQDSNCELK